MLLIKLFLNIALIITGVNMNTTSTIIDYFDKAESFIVYIDNNIEEYANKTQEYNRILKSLQEIVTEAHEMPAYGVSTDIDTKEALTQGIWLELKFAETQTHSDMPFDRLLIQVDSEYSGFNLIRYHDNKYDGRCYYLNLDKDMSILYTCLIDIM